MTAGVLLDLVLVGMLVAYGRAGYRQGAVVSVLSLAGFLGGGALAMWFLPLLVDDLSSEHAAILRRPFVVVLIVFVVASVGQALAIGLGRRLRGGVRAQTARVADSVIGLVVVVAATSLLAWFVAGAIRYAAPAPVSQAISQSRVLRAIDAVVPERTTALFSGFRATLDRTGFPRVFEGIAEPIAPVAVPDPTVVRAAGVRAAAGSIVKITGVADACCQEQEGTGFVIAPGKILTNAHVVAGLDSVTIRVRGTGRTHTGEVVAFDAQRDLAVVSVPSLDAPALTQGSPLARGESAVVAGFPLNGPYAVRPARIREVLDARGADIYGRSGTTREVYSLYAQVEPGNSGGPLLDQAGRVVGVVFATSLDDPSTGYALTLAEAQPVIKAADTATRQVSSGNCLAR